MASRASRPSRPSRPTVVLVDKEGHSFEVYKRRGQRFLEVFSVRLKSINGKNCGKLYGTIGFTKDGTTYHLIYYRRREDYESVKKGETFTLMGPSRCIYAYDDIFIDFHLRDFDKDDDDEEAIGGFIYCKLTCFYTDELITEKLVGKQGSLIVKYAVFEDALQATVEVILINNDSDDNDPTCVCGFLTAKSKLLGQEISLFRAVEAAKQYIKVRPGDGIPLLRSVVAAPLDFNLTVQAELYEYEGHQIAKGCANFTPQLPKGTSVQSITGKCGEIEVRVTWENPMPKMGGTSDWRPLSDFNV